MFKAKPKNDLEKNDRSVQKPNVKKKSKKSKLNRELLVLDVGSKTTKLVVGKFNGDNLIIDMINGAVNTKNSCIDGKIIEKNEVQNTIRNLINASNVKIKNTVITMESTEFIRKDLEIASVPNADVLGVVSFGMAQYLPTDINSYIIQVKNIEEINEKASKKKKVSVGVMPKAIITGYVELTDELNLEREAMDMNSNALEKLLSLEIENNQRSELAYRNVVFIDMGHSFFNISIYNNGKYLFNKVLNIGGSMIDSVISDIMNTTSEEAEMIKIENNEMYTAMDLQYKFGNTVEKPKSKEDRILNETLYIYDSWTSEINQVLKYYTTRNRNNSINEIYLYGGGSFINGIDEYFEKKLQIPTKDFIDFSCIKLPTLELNKNILNYLNAIGALIRY